ncbi:leucine-rich repeat domain-containing protein [Prevotella falsenii]
METLYFYPPNKQGTVYNIPASVKTIARRGFQSAQHLTSMVIPQNVEAINEEAFRTAKAIETISFAETSKVKSIEYHAFRALPKLKEVTLPSTLSEISQIFFECENLETVNVPDNSQLKKILKDAFTTNTKLKAFNFQGSSVLEEINENAFANLKELATFNFPKSVVSIKANAFSGCSGMTKVSFASDAAISVIGSGAFADCGLNSFDVPNKVQTIEREAFRNCKALKTINVTETTTKISPEAFKYCSNLTGINVSKKNQVYSSVDGYLLSKNKETLIIFPAGKANNQFTLLPPSIKEIGEYAFYDCKELKNVTIPNKVTTIGKRAFGLCSNLNTITFLCDAMIPAANINQLQSEMSFDDGTQAADMFKNITINVRKERLAEYEAEPFYKKFKQPIGVSFTEGTEEYIAVSDKDVDMLSTTRKDYTFVLPTEVKHNGKTYNVSLIGDYAFQNATKDIKEVVVKKNVKYIGAKAFVTKISDNTSTVESVFFIESTPNKSMLSTTRFELDETGTNYNEFAATTKVYVKKSALANYKTEWAKTVYDVATDKDKKSNFDFTSQLDYQIKDVKINHKYGTFAREFDVDFSIYKKEMHKGDIGAFVGRIGEVKPGNGDYGTSTYHIRMSSVDLNGVGSGNYGYVPANTGVLLKVLEQETIPTDFYYAIGEDDDKNYSITNNIMYGITVNPRNVSATTTGEVIYVMQKGIFRKAMSTIALPIHKAYAKIEGVPEGAKVEFSFSDDNTTNAIMTIDEATTVDDNAYYNLNGQRISKPQKGVYIHKGKKIIIR